ncbi:LysR substrate-binding domain-containing protein [Nocardioides sp. DS6]|uniref:LysR substrate-binding domain-containing protein n=1 Tax=Nocardioides eburneus TaxID=3231482 RepID=A0ABV3SY99_9ACTN
MSAVTSRSSELPFTLRQLQLFVAVAEAGSLTGAADQLLLSPTAVSLAIGHLEKALGETLFTRQRSRGVALTSTGRFVLDRARAVLHTADEFLQDTRVGPDRLTGAVTIGCFQSLGPTVLPILLSTFTERHPAVEISFVEGSQDELSQALEQGTIDVLVCYDFTLPAGSERARLGTRDPAVLLPGGHWAACDLDTPLDVTLLAAEPYILLATPVTEQHALKVLGTLGVEPEVRYRSTNIETVRSLVGRGLGWTLILQRPAPNRTYEGLPVVTRVLRGDAPPEVVVLAWRRNRPLSRVARALVEHARVVVPEAERRSDRVHDAAAPASVVEH